MSETKLNPCIRCGKTGHFAECIEPHTHSIATFMPDHPGSFVIECSCGEAVIAETEEEAIEKWNRHIFSALLEAAEEVVATPQLCRCARRFCLPCCAKDECPFGKLKSAVERAKGGESKSRTIAKKLTEHFFKNGQMEGQQ